MKKLLFFTLTSLLIAALIGCSQPPAETSDTTGEITTRATETTALPKTRYDTPSCFDITGTLNMDILLFACGKNEQGEYKSSPSVMCEEKDNVLTVYYFYQHYGSDINAPLLAVPIEIYTIEGSFDDFISGKDMKILSTETYDIGIGNGKEMWDLLQYFFHAENIFIEDYASEGKDVYRHAVHERDIGGRGAGYYIIDDVGEANSANTAHLFDTIDRLLREYANK